MASGVILRVDVQSPVPVYRQIVSGLRTLLVQGELRPGDALPTVRQLALDLGVHHNTVAEAYRILASERWLDLRRRRGVRVLEREPPAEIAHDAEQRFLARLRELIAETTSAGLPKTTIALTLRSVADTLE